MLSALYPHSGPAAWPGPGGLACYGASRSCLVEWNPLCSPLDCGLDGVPPNPHVRVLTPSTQKVTLCGEEVPTAVTKGKMRSLVGGSNPT